MVNFENMTEDSTQDRRCYGRGGEVILMVKACPDGATIFDDKCFDRLVVYWQMVVHTMLTSTANLSRILVVN